MVSAASWNIHLSKGFICSLKCFACSKAIMAFLIIIIIIIKVCKVVEMVSLTQNTLTVLGTAVLPSGSLVLFVFALLSVPYGFVCIFLIYCCFNFA